MDYGDPLGIVLFWLCYQREIIAVALFISAFVIAGIITAHYEKKKTIKNKKKKKRRKTFKLNKIFKRKRKRSRNKHRTTRTVSNGPRDLDYDCMMMHKQLRSELEKLEALEPGEVHTVSVTSPFGTLSMTRLPENPEITKSANVSNCCCAVSAYTPKSFITSANLGLVDSEPKHDGKPSWDDVVNTVYGSKL